MKLSDRKHKLTCFVIMTLVLIKMGLYWPNFSLLFLIHLFLYAGVYCTHGKELALVVQTIDSTIHWINDYPVDKY